MRPSSAAKVISPIFLAFLLATAILAASAHAQTFTVLHTFKGAPTDGEAPFGQLIRDSAGNLYGTTNSGGAGKCTSGCGTAFMLNKAGKEVGLYSFGGKNGGYPLAGLFRDSAGNFYGTTTGGGANCYGMGYPGCGTVFKLSKTGKETLLYSFAGTPDGYTHEALLVGGDGSLYGTTLLGGASGGYGTVFKLDKVGQDTILHTFTGPPGGGGDGADPYAGVIRDAAGNLYGVTDAGGAYCCGVVYEIDTTGTETLLYSFTGFSDGDGPLSVLLLDSAGNLYGTTKAGGNEQCGGSGCGVVFELSPQPGRSWTESVLYVFCSLPNCADGEKPLAGPLVRDAAGNLYGTTFFGGTADDGVVFKLDGSGKETVLHSFTGGADGGFPWAGLTMDSAGNLYGGATGGGDFSCFPPSGCGVVFKITP
jgi:uncharacterized repeat protein (TIGR03803 family)